MAEKKFYFYDVQNYRILNTQKREMLDCSVETIKTMSNSVFCFYVFDTIQHRRCIQRKTVSSSHEIEILYAF